VATCATCGNALCADCIVRTGVGVKCRSCTGVKAVKPGKASDLDVPERAEAPSAGRRKPLAVALLAGGVVVLAVAGYGLVSRDSGPAATETAQVVAPPPFTERQSEFVGPGGQRIGGTLTLPGAGPAEGETVPAVLIVPGLGALDRNSVVAASPPDAFRDALVTTVGGVPLGSGDPLYKDLSESLAQVGIASFRYDRRATKAVPVPSGQKLSFDDEVGDARAALDLLSKRAEIGVSPLVVLGHDTGSIVAMRVSIGNPRVKAVVALSTPSKPLAEALATDLGRSRGDAVADAFRSAVATLRASGTAPPADTLPEVLRPIFGPGQDAYLNALLAVEPPAEVFRVDKPLLFVRGGGDPTVTAADTDRLRSSLRTSGQVMVGSSDADHNLTLAGPGHEHSNAVVGVVSHRDTDVSAGLTAWIKANIVG
jgi:pimeloyl-ACP methyl ester carboxylesterase